MECHGIFLIVGKPRRSTNKNKNGYKEKFYFSDIGLSLPLVSLDHCSTLKTQKMTTQEVAKRLVALCKEGKWEEVYQELFSPAILSIEPEGAPWGKVQGFDAIAEKAKKWQEMVEEVHSMEISDPIVAENFFAITMKSKVTMKGQNEPINMDEVCVYNVVDGKVISEQFFYTPMPELV